MTQPAKPFKRAAALYMEALELKATYGNNLTLLQTLINALPPYVSRGHGRKPRRMCRTTTATARSKYMPHQGKSECARRVFQSLPKDRRAYIRSIEAKVNADGLED